jgi:hypothetical protein
MPLRAPLLRRLPILLLCGLATACAHRPTAALRSAHDAHAASLRRAGSLEELRRFQAAAEQFDDAAEAYRRARLCQEPAHQGRWFCKPVDDNSGLDRVEVTGSRIEAPDVITNNQEAGVDEGDLVKKLGDRLIVLRQGRLHVIELTAQGVPALRLVDTAVVAADDDGRDTWFDEIIAAGGWIVLLGYNPDHGVAELSVFQMEADGRLTQRARHWLETHDYFDDDNYGARFVGEELVLSFSVELDTALDRWPEAWRRDLPGAARHPLLQPAAVHVPLEVSESPTLHALLRCPVAALAGERLECRATGIVGSAEKQIYATTRAAYVVLAETPWRGALDPRIELRYELEDADRLALEAMNYSLVYRLPFDGGPLAVARAEGVAHAAQFSFLETERDLFLLTQRHFGGEALLQRLGLDSFGPRPSTAPQLLATLPPHWGARPFDRVSRFAHGALWVADTHRIDDEDDEVNVFESVLLRQPLDGGAPERVDLPQSIHRLDPFGDSMLMTGIARDDVQTVVALDGGSVAVDPAAAVRLPGHYVSEDRSHAFNAAATGDTWTLGLPVLPRSIVEDDDLWPWPPSDIAYFSLADGRLRTLGISDMPDAAEKCDDAACDEWYGNARLFFIGPRSFALSGDWLREVSLSGAGVATLREVQLK